MLGTRKSLLDRTVQNGRDLEGSTAIGLAGLAAATVVGAVVVRHLGGFDGVRARLARLGHALKREALELSPEGAFDNESFVGHGLAEGDMQGGLEYDVADVLLRDPRLGHRAIDVEKIDDGVIRLSGFVHDLSEVEHATDLSSRTPGVKRVITRLTVRGDDILMADSAEMDAVDGVGASERRRGDALDIGSTLVVVTAEGAEA